MFAQTLVNHAPVGPFIVLSAVESTNNYAMAKLHARIIATGSCFLALDQTAGKGQRGKEWRANAGENITMSTVFQPGSYTPFVYSAAMALGCYDFIKGLGVPEPALKWPNDVYVNDRKAAGLLIENIYKGAHWAQTVVGTGINLNQTDFFSLAQKAISIKQLTGRSYDVVKAGRILHRHLCERHQWVAEHSAEDVLKEYNSRLYKKDQEVRLKKENIVFTTVIEKVALNGELVTRDAIERRFRVGEVQFV